MKKLICVLVLALMAAMPAVGQAGLIVSILPDAFQADSGFQSLDIYLAATETVDLASFEAKFMANGFDFDYGTSAGLFDEPGMLAAGTLLYPDSKFVAVSATKTAQIQLLTKAGDSFSVGTTPGLLGTIRVQTDGLANGPYTIDFDGIVGISPNVDFYEGVQGSGTFTVVPEPSSIVMASLGLGGVLGLGFVRRRRNLKKAAV